VIVTGRNDKKYGSSAEFFGGLDQLENIFLDEKDVFFVALDDLRNHTRYRVWMGENKCYFV